MYDLIRILTNQKGVLSHFSVFSAFVDNANTLWIGTYAGGVSYSNPLNSRFTFYDLQGGSDKLFGIFATMAYQRTILCGLLRKGEAYFHWI